mmetsp:Transcript_26286/g.68509  ORF Transcript_26286/g.68509 Transcript_26286/m.68509 type:complete len:309 (+) Transcript_26286:223-1149(+)
MSLVSASKRVSSSRAVQRRCAAPGCPGPPSGASSPASNRYRPSMSTTCKCRKLWHAESMAVLFATSILAGLSDSCTSWVSSSVSSLAATNLQPPHRSSFEWAPKSLLNSVLTLSKVCSCLRSASSFNSLTKSMWSDPSSSLSSPFLPFFLLLASSSLESSLSSLCLRSSPCIFLGPLPLTLGCAASCSSMVFSVSLSDSFSVAGFLDLLRFVLTAFSTISCAVSWSWLYISMMCSRASFLACSPSSSCTSSFRSAASISSPWSSPLLLFFCFGSSSGAAPFLPFFFFLSFLSFFLSFFFLPFSGMGPA